MENPEKEQILTEIISTQSLSDYEAVAVLWIALTKVADLITGVSENSRQRMLSLVERFSEEEIKRLLKDGSVDSLIFLDPPLETILTGPDEKLDEDSTMRIIAKIRSSRDSNPGEALVNLGEILGRIRYKHVHRSKTGSVSLGKEILSLTRKILYLLCILAISKLT